MSPAYQSLVKQHYEKKKNEHDLPLGLMYPTPAKLRAECLAAFSKTILKKDRKILSDFFEESGDDGAIIKKIKNYDVDGFKPLLNYLRGISSSTDPKNIELLAWLTGFEDRPFDYLKYYSLEKLQPIAATIVEELPDDKKEREKEKQIEENKIVEDKVVDVAPNEANLVIVEKKNDVGKKTSLLAPLLISIKRLMIPKVAIAALLIFAAAMVGIVIYLKNNGEGCMYWAGDHYEQVPCNPKMGRNTLVIALDNEKLNFFKKITREDTITRNDIGKVWYVKIDGKMEYFTSDGNYPLDPKRSLKPLTEYIIENHIDTIGKDISH